MSFATLIADRKGVPLSYSDPALVHIQEGVPVVVSSDIPRKSPSWPLRFVLAGALGIIGGLVAAITVNPAPPPFPVFQQPWAQTSTVSAAQPSETIVVPPATREALAASSPKQTEEEVNRLKTRNRRLEALVRVLRERKAASKANGASLSN